MPDHFQGFSLCPFKAKGCGSHSTDQAPVHTVSVIGRQSLRPDR